MLFGHLGLQCGTVILLGLLVVLSLGLFDSFGALFFRDTFEHKKCVNSCSIDDWFVTGDQSIFFHGLSWLICLMNDKFLVI